MGTYHFTYTSNVCAQTIAGHTKEKHGSEMTSHPRNRTPPQGSTLWLQGGSPRALTLTLTGKMAI